MVSARYPTLAVHLDQDCFVVWLRWVSLEQPPSPDEPPSQGVRVELQLNRNPVLGPTIVYRRDLEDAPVYLRANSARTRDVLRAASASGGSGFVGGGGGASGSALVTKRAALRQQAEERAAAKQ